MTDAPRIGAARIVTSADGTYTPDPAGEWAAVMPVMGFTVEPVGFNVERHLVWDDIYGLIDLVAWHPTNPGRWWLRRGDMTPILGVRDLRMAADLNESITVYETPEAWGRDAGAGGHGVCVLQWAAPLNELFEGVARVECESPRLKRRLVSAWRSWEPGARLTQYQRICHAA